MIAFYYGLTGFACAIYYRQRADRQRQGLRLHRRRCRCSAASCSSGCSARASTTSPSPANSESGDSWFGVGPPLVIGLGLLLVGVVLMIVWRVRGGPEVRRFFARRPETVAWSHARRRPRHRLRRHGGRPRGAGRGPGARRRARGGHRPRVLRTRRSSSAARRTTSTPRWPSARRQVLAEGAALVEAAGVAVTTEAREGTPADVLAEVAAERRRPDARHRLLRRGARCGRSSSARRPSACCGRPTGRCWSCGRGVDSLGRGHAVHPARPSTSPPPPLGGATCAWRPPEAANEDESGRRTRQEQHAHDHASGPRPGPHLRHHPARRGAVAGHQPQHGREARDRPPARPAGGRRHRGGLPDRVARRLRGGPGHRPGGRRSGRRRAGARQPGRRRARLGGGARGRAAADPHVRLDLGHPHRPPAAGHARGRQGPGPRGRRAGQGLHATTSSSRPWTPPAPTSSSPPRCSRSPSTRARRRSTSPTPSGTRCRRSTPPSSAGSTTSSRASATSSSRSTATTTSGWRSRTRSRASWPARGRSSARSTASASAPATRRWRSS